MSLALMPVDQVISGFNEIQSAAEQLVGNPMEDLLRYFERNWLNNIELWNVFKRDTRTNNVCEGKNR